MSFKAVSLQCVRHSSQPLFSNLSFQLEAGELLLVEGANGSGKSSLLRVLTGLATPAFGDIFWQQQSIQTSSDYRAALHYLGHSNGLKLGLTVMENVRLMQQLHTAELPLKTATILSALKLDTYLHTPTRYLSAGQKRRVALARILLAPRLLWILDEPLTALDSETQAFFLSQLQIHLEQGGVAIISSHHAFTLPTIRVQHMRLG